MNKPTGVHAFSVFGLLAIAITLLGLSACKARSGITQYELVLGAQELVDSVAGGDQTPWKKYFADDAMFFDERGENMNKAALVAGITPLPAGHSGTIKVIKPQSQIERNVAILSYDLDETEIIYGQIEKARYHETDTWMGRNGQWQIIASQVLRYYEDPAPGKVDSAKFEEYVGTYELAPGDRLTISTEGQDLYRKRGDQPKSELIPEATDILFRKGVEGRILFRHADNGKVDALIDRRNNEDVIWKKVQ
jgi:hypothetical protein